MNVRKILGSLLIAIFLLFLLELSLRLVDMPNQYSITNMDDMFESGVFMRDRLLFWRFIPEKTYTEESPHYKGTLRINSIGFREREISKIKPQRTYRIFCLGGSSTCGDALFEEERFSNILEKKLNSQLGSLHFEVYNFGGPGYSTLQMKRLLENELIGLEPDLVIVNPEQADRWPLSDKAAFPDSKIIVLSPIFFNIVCFLESESRLYRAIKQLNLSMSWRHKSEKKDVEIEEFIRVSSEEHKANLEVMLETCRENNIEIVFLSSLGVEDKKAFVIYDGYEVGPRIDIVSLFENGRENGLFQRDDHISAKAHSIIADAIFRYLGLKFTL